VFNISSMLFMRVFTSHRY